MCLILSNHPSKKKIFFITNLIFLSAKIVMKILYLMRYLNEVKSKNDILKR